ncbi:unnamed protein product [Microthlaspi erraticum]|uniref:Uncharacterized protein n=1 Tax=Microthlaspi erraticum TaxID=1685480 RepID=A0A6D2J3L8_9BRAS|nr:unnamed protein product [Microthlaspi erraticum]
MDQIDIKISEPHNFERRFCYLSGSHLECIEVMYLDVATFGGFDLLMYVYCPVLKLLLRFSNQLMYVDMRL